MLWRLNLNNNHFGKSVGNGSRCCRSLFVFVSLFSLSLSLSLSLLCRAYSFIRTSRRLFSNRTVDDSSRLRPEVFFFFPFHSSFIFLDSFLSLVVSCLSVYNTVIERHCIRVGVSLSLSPCLGLVRKNIISALLRGLVTGKRRNRRNCFNLLVCLQLCLGYFDSLNSPDYNFLLNSSSNFV